MEEKEFSCRPQDDLYTAVNGEWLKHAVIPGDQATVGGFTDLAMGVEKIMMADFARFAKEGAEVPSELVRSIRLYRKALDVETREKVGLTPIAGGIALLQGIHELADVSKQALALKAEHVALPFSAFVDVDAKDSDHYAITCMGPSTILPDTSFYKDLQASGGAALLQVWKDMAVKLLSQAPGIDAAKAASIADGALRFDALIATKVKSSVEWADSIAAYNPTTLGEAAKQLVGFDLAGYFAHRFHVTEANTKVIFAETRYFASFGEIFNAKTLPDYVDWALAKLVILAAGFASEAQRIEASTFRRTMYGIKEAAPLEKYAYRTADSFFADLDGIYYGKTYFGAKAKEDVTTIAKDIIKAYGKRIASKQWLSPATRKMAQVKLSTMVLKLGYPEKVSPVFQQITVDEDDCFMTAIFKILNVSGKYSDSLLGKVVDRSLWVMPAHLVNACYNPTSNDLTFPAAILQAPFYSIEQTRAENLGGIGTVIGHEISHAFDNNGAQFDEKGNIHNWWTEDDYKNFRSMIKAETEQFDHLPLCGSFTSGELIVSESVADNGGMGVSLEVAHEEGVTDFKPFFINFARIWCMKAHDGYTLTLLKTDVHAPNYWRANMQPRNFPEWYEAFGVKPTDKMYLPVEKRVSIW